MIRNEFEREKYFCLLINVKKCRKDISNTFDNFLRNDKNKVHIVGTKKYCQA